MTAPPRRADFHEALTIASVQKLPNVFVIENNQFAYSTPLPLQSNSAKFSDKAVAYGIPGVTVDGTDVLAVHDAVAEGGGQGEGGRRPVDRRGRDDAHARARRARSGGLRAASEMFEEWSKKDPVELFEKRLLAAGVIDEDTAKQVRAEARQAAIDARKRALGDPMPDPSNVEEGVYAD